MMPHPTSPVRSPPFLPGCPDPTENRSPRITRNSGLLFVCYMSGRSNLIEVPGTTVSSCGAGSPARHPSDVLPVTDTEDEQIVMAKLAYAAYGETTEWKNRSE